MPDIKEVTYMDEDGTTAHLAYIEHPRPIAPPRPNLQREEFCRLMAFGHVTQYEAYCRAFHKTIGDGLTKESAEQSASRMFNDTDVILRIQELRKPLVRKLRRKFEYTVQKALEQCEVAWSLAYATGDAKSMLAAIRMQADLSKLLSQQIDVNHRYGLLDDADTETLLEMRRQIEVSQGKQKKLRQIAATKVETVAEEGAEASFVVS